MANEITLSIALTLTRTVQLANWTTGALSLNQTGSRYSQNIQSVLTTATPLQIGSVGTLGYMMVKNLDTFTNNPMYLLTTTAGVRFMTLYGGQAAVLPLGPDIPAPYVSCVSTAAQIETMVFEL